ncbi:MAG: hypothetical protein ACOCXC_05270, partial [Fibrobacterota bacterium]
VQRSGFNPNSTFEGFALSTSSDNNQILPPESKVTELAVMLVAFESLLTNFGDWIYLRIFCRLTEQDNNAFSR